MVSGNETQENVNLALASCLSVLGISSGPENRRALCSWDCRFDVRTGRYITRWMVKDGTGHLRYGAQFISDSPFTILGFTSGTVGVSLLAFSMTSTSSERYWESPPSD